MIILFIYRNKKQHGTSSTPVQTNLRWKVDRETADRICNFNRHYAEHSGYFSSYSKNDDSFLKMGEQEYRKNKRVVFYDSNTGKPLFIIGQRDDQPNHTISKRTWSEFIRESRAHGWPSFRDDEVVWENVRCLSNGEAVSLAGTHLGHNLPDAKGNRYCINLVSVAGNPKPKEPARLPESPE